jgi:hypothetical protein
MVYVETVHDRTTRPCLTFWVGSDMTEEPYSSSWLEVKANERTAQLKRCSNMGIRLNIEMRCARRQNDAAYQRYRRRSVTGRHAITIHRRHMEYQHSRGMFLRFGCKAAAESWSDRASFPDKWEQAPREGFKMQRMFVNPKSSAGCVHVEPRLFQIWPF